jgi:CDP-glycerol glycerophosphotransferase (TagB/SpsB family)
LVYKPHPKITTSVTPGVSDAHLAIVRLVAEAARRDPAAGHTQVLGGDILAVMPGCDVLVTDVSSVGLDWLYLHTEKPIFLTDRHGNTERLRQQVPISRCADVIDASGVHELTTLLRDRLENDEHQLARVAMRRHYFDDLHVGDSTARFLEAVSELVALRDQLMGEAAAAGETAITA